jgi:hypothetical protein
MNGLFYIIYIALGFSTYKNGISSTTQMGENLTFGQSCNLKPKPHLFALTK